MRGHVHRLKAVALDWLPRRLDPLAFYHWRHPLHNLLFLWLLSHLCLYPGRWLLTMAVIVTLLLLRRIAIQVGGGAGLGTLLALHWCGFLLNCRQWTGGHCGWACGWGAACCCESQ